MRLQCLNQISWALLLRSNSAPACCSTPTPVLHPQRHSAAEHQWVLGVPHQVTWQEREGGEGRHTATL